jgi:hypothetical protein
MLFIPICLGLHLMFLTPDSANTQKGLTVHKISEQQMEAFEFRQNQEFLKKLKYVLTRDFPKIVSNLNDSQIEARMNRGLELGLKYSMKEKAEFVRFVYLYFGLGEELLSSEDAAWIRDILNMQFSGTHRLDLIDEVAEELSTKGD